MLVFDELILSFSCLLQVAKRSGTGCLAAPPPEPVVSITRRSQLLLVENVAMAQAAQGAKFSSVRQRASAEPSRIMTCLFSMSLFRAHPLFVPLGEGVSVAAFEQPTSETSRRSRPLPQLASKCATRHALSMRASMLVLLRCTRAWPPRFALATTTSLPAAAAAIVRASSS